MMRKDLLLLVVIMLSVMFCSGGCAPVVPPPPRAPLPLPHWNWLARPMYCLTPLVTLLVIALLIVALVSFLRGKRLPTIRSFREPSAKQIVQERYARGEISREEYRQLMRDLEEPEQV